MTEEKNAPVQPDEDAEMEQDSEFLDQESEEFVDVEQTQAAPVSFFAMDYEANNNESLQEDSSDCDDDDEQFAQTRVMSLDQNPWQESIDTAAKLREENSQLLEQVESLTAERDDHKNRMLRVAADLENFRRRAQREKEEQRKYGIDKVVMDLIPTVDNLERALQHVGDEAASTSIVDGVRMVYRQIVAALEKHGAKAFVSKGEQFDPQRHEAIQQVETSEHPTGQVMEEFQKGYFLHDRLLRPALVAVAKNIAPISDDGPDMSSDATDNVDQEDPAGQGASETSLKDEGTDNSTIH